MYDVRFTMYDLFTIFVFDLAENDFSLSFFLSSIILLSIKNECKGTAFFRHEQILAKCRFLNLTVTAVFLANYEQAIYFQQVTQVINT